MTCHSTSTEQPSRNGTIGCSSPEHTVNEPAPPGLTRADHIQWIVNHAPPLSADQRDKLALILSHAQRR
jgi:hypothetical protein